MASPVLNSSAFAWQQRWPIAYPHAHLSWTLADGHQHWARLDPETGYHETVDPAKDADLPALSSALTSGDLIGYRVGRRAVIATATSFIKVVRPKRLALLVDKHMALEPTKQTYVIPKVLRTHTKGAVELSIVEGTSLHHLLRSTTGEQHFERYLGVVAAGLAEFHSAAMTLPLAERQSDRVEEWLNTLARLEPNEMVRQFSDVAASLPPLLPPTTAPTIVHSDLHDKNIFVNGPGIALIDLDGLAIGAPEDDVGNLGTHLQLRALQAGHPERVGRRNSRLLYACYQRHRDLDMNRIHAVERHTWFRLACLYQYRSASRPLVPELLAHAANKR